VESGKGGARIKGVMDRMRRRKEEEEGKEKKEKGEEQEEGGGVGGRTRKSGIKGKGGRCYLNCAVAFDIFSGDPLYWTEPAVTRPSVP